MLLVVLPWISSVLGTEKEMLIGKAFLLSAEKDFWRRRMLVLYEGEATVTAKSLP